MAHEHTGERTAGAAELQQLLAEFVRGIEALPLPTAVPSAARDTGTAIRAAELAMPPLPAGGVSAFEACAGARAHGQAATPFPELFRELPSRAPRRRHGERVASRAALEAFPHVLEGLALLWNDAGCLAYLQRLVVDTRGGRRGFPPEAMSELLFLFELRGLRH
jgi:hypothetical protein